jgi:DNA/RNA endonuclease YhcR with UshA esterase domain
MMRCRTVIACFLTLSAVQAASAHHSFAAFFDPDKTVTVKGIVTSYHFTNPHGLIAIDVKGAGGQVEHWRAETNAPVVLMRRGWTRETLKPGETVTLSGWASRDGKPYLRLRQANRADGSVIGVPFDASDK